MGRFVDLTGQKFGRLTVIERDINAPKNKGVMWVCLCECGNKKSVKTGNLKTNGVQSCGCILNERRTKDDFHNSHLYKVYHAIKRRCYNERASDYEFYGGRGIGMCEEWLNDGYAFYYWSMANGYKDGLTIDRVDNSNDYSPDNCRWVDMKEQCNNRRSNHLITYNGKTQSLTKWSDDSGIGYHKLRYRIINGWDIEKAFNTP